MIFLKNETYPWADNSWSWKMGTWKLIIFFLLVWHTYIHTLIWNCLQQTFFKNIKKKEKEIKTGHHSKVLKKWSLKHMELDIVSHKLSSFQRDWHGYRILQKNTTGRYFKSFHSYRNWSSGWRTCSNYLVSSRDRLETLMV